jgi:AcrR family transcriptional regulator
MTQRTEEPGQRGLTRERLVAAALGLIQEEGLDGLSMRALADRLDVKAASIYWHVRDRGELVEMLADSIAGSVHRPRGAAGWRPAVAGLAAALGEAISRQRDAARVLLEAPDALERSAVFRELRAQLSSAGLAPAEAAEVARMVTAHVITRLRPDGDLPPADHRVADAAAELAIDSGSRGVHVRAGTPDMETPVRFPSERSAAAPAVIRGEKVVVRRLRGVGRGGLELNPRRPWRIHVQAPTWNTFLELGALTVRGVHIDSGAAKVEIYLPRPAGVVPIHISSGVVGVALHRPRGTAVVADLSTGVVRPRLDDFSTRATVFDTHWQSEDASAATDRYELRISSGAVRVELDSYELKTEPAGAPAPADDAAARSSALEILLDGVEARLAARRAAPQA